MLDEFASTLDGQICDDDPAGRVHVAAHDWSSVFSSRDSLVPQIHTSGGHWRCAKRDPQLPEARILTDLAQMLLHSFFELGPVASADDGRPPSTSALG